MALKLVGPRMKHARSASANVLILLVICMHLYNKECKTIINAHSFKRTSEQSGSFEKHLQV